MNLYDEFYPFMADMLDEFGADATLTSTAPPAPALAAKRAGRATVTEQPQSRPTRAVVGPVEVTGADGRKTYPTLATLLTEPLQGETLTMGASSWVIGKVSFHAPQGRPIVYMAEVA
jgi:hypothetical protein